MPVILTSSPATKTATSGCTRPGTRRRCNRPPRAHDSQGIRKEPLGRRLFLIAAPPHEAICPNTSKPWRISSDDGQPTTRRVQGSPNRQLSKRPLDKSGRLGSSLYRPKRTYPSAPWMTAFDPAGGCRSMTWSVGGPSKGMSTPLEVTPKGYTTEPRTCKKALLCRGFEVTLWWLRGNGGGEGGTLHRMCEKAR
jgi:hypothetical protein